MSRVKVEQSQERTVEWGKETHTSFFPHPCSESKLAIFVLCGRNNSNKGNKRTYADVQKGCWKGLPGKQNRARHLKRIQKILEIWCCKTLAANIIFRSVYRVFQMGSSLLSKFTDRMFVPWENWMKKYYLCIHLFKF